MTLQINDRVLATFRDKQLTGTYLGTSRERDGVHGKDDYVHVRFEGLDAVGVVASKDCIPLAPVRRRFVDLHEAPLTRAGLAAMHDQMQEWVTELHTLASDSPRAQLLVERMDALALFLLLFKPPA